MNKVKNFFNKIKYIIIRIKEYYLGICGLFLNGIHVNYCIENNAGDSFNNDFLKEISNKRILKYSFGKTSHILFCGSVLSRSNSKSTILGAGFISLDQAKMNIEFLKVIGVRGYKTLEYLEMKNPNISPVFVGDPGLLARELIPINKGTLASDKIGIIPHFVDYRIAERIISDSSDFLLIDIKKSYIDVCEDIKNCRVVLSSSLHGLVFSDAMGVSNVWISFGNNLKGGKFKFLDYYSAMTNPRVDWIFCKSLNDLSNATGNARVSENPMYEEMKSAVIDFVRSI